MIGPGYLIRGRFLSRIIDRQPIDSGMSGRRMLSWRMFSWRMLRLSLRRLGDALRRFFTNLGLEIFWLQRLGRIGRPFLGRTFALLAALLPVVCPFPHIAACSTLACAAAMRGLVPDHSRNQLGHRVMSIGSSGH